MLHGRFLSRRSSHARAVIHAPMRIATGQANGGERERSHAVAGVLVFGAEQQEGRDAGRDERVRDEGEGESAHASPFALSASRYASSSASAGDDCELTLYRWSDVGPVMQTP